MSRDFTAITETPGVLLSPDQRTRMVQRYGRAAALAQGGRVLQLDDVEPEPFVQVTVTSGTC